ncbi:MAG TPA: DUF1475 family protein [Chitinophagaceae bacterium]|nr:DUF1475 family protein [Chitinophagaceae bacterium]
MITTLKILFSAVFVYMSYTVITTSMQSNLFKEWDYLAGIPWMRATLYDFYCNALLIIIWVAYKETAVWSKILWLILLTALGSIATSAYVLIQLFRLKKGEGLRQLLLNKN